MVYETDEMTHHGIKGMRWGVRRTPAQLGHKTSPKKKRTPSRFEVAIKNKYKHHKEVKANKKLLKKDISKLTDEELITAIRRKQIENQYEALHPNQSLPKRFVKSVGKDVLAPATIEAGKYFVKNSLIKLADKYLKDGNSLEALENEWKILDYQEKIKNIKNPKAKEESADDVRKRMDNESRQKDIDSGLDDIIRKNKLREEQRKAAKWDREDAENTPSPQVRVFRSSNGKVPVRRLLDDHELIDAGQKFVINRQEI